MSNGYDDNPVVARYMKGIIAVVTAAVTICAARGIVIDSDAVAQVVAAIGAVLVILVPNQPA